MKTIQFTYRTKGTCDGYYCSEPGDRDGEYVPADTARQLLAALEGVVPHAIGHSKFGCKGKKRDPENCSVCKSIWAARDAIAAAKGEPLS